MGLDERAAKLTVPTFLPLVVLVVESFTEPNHIVHIDALIAEKLQTSIYYERQNSKQQFRACMHGIFVKHEHQLDCKRRKEEEIQLVREARTTGSSSYPTACLPLSLEVKQPIRLATE